ncbi:hypothetical protein LIER_27880 [Lithospermum erythrorhizon]|uniref:Uncharacterized protein n=1 Tax=Lithospermum erythrorhizon TaxID=34254 RepID=A0AAV3RHQ1_LITER
MDENGSLDKNSPPGRYRSLDENLALDKYRLLDKNRPLDPRFICQLFPSLWDTRPSPYMCLYLDKRVFAYLVLSHIKDMSGGSSQEIPPNSTPLTSAPSQQDVVPSRKPDSPVTPLSIRPPSSSTMDSPHGRLTPPTSQSPGSSQAGESSDKPGDTPTIIQESLPVAFLDEDLNNFRRYFSISSFIEMRLPLEGDRVFEPLVDPSHTEGDLTPGWTAMYIKSLCYGARFPFYPFVNDALIAVNHPPGQIRPLGG